MRVYCLVEANPEKFSSLGLPIYYNGEIACDKEPWSHSIRNALLYTTAEAAEADVPIANDWWNPHDFRVKPIELEDVLGTATKFKCVAVSLETQRSQE